MGKKYYMIDDIRWKEKCPVWMIPQIKFVRMKRRCEYWKKRSKIVYAIIWILYRKMEIKYNTDIPAMVKIGPGFKIRHLGNIVFNPNVEIGSNVDILNGVLLGQIDCGKKKGYPVIGNNVFIGSNAIVVGNVRIGNDVVIAPGAFVNFDVPDHSIVLGNPGKIISKLGASNGYIKNKIEGIIYDEI